MRARANAQRRRDRVRCVAEERVRRETAALLCRLGFPRCDRACGRRADDVLITGDVMHPMATACAYATKDGRAAAQAQDYRRRSISYWRPTQGTKCPRVITLPVLGCLRLPDEGDET
jgi:hypothetical protein